MEPEEPIGLTAQQLHAMKLHEHANLGNHLTVTRVVGGWIYNHGFVLNDENYALGFNSTFVPEPSIK
jgi:hypothetical protein